MEGGNLRIVSFVVCEVEVIGKSLLFPRESATKTYIGTHIHSVTFKWRVHSVYEATSE